MAIDRSLTMPRLAAALTVIVVLAFVLPYLAVRALLQVRLDRADRQMQTIASDVSARLGSSPSAVPGGTHVLAGAGLRPIATDDVWNTAPAFPLVRVIGDVDPDPWGNAYFVNVTDRGRMWIISAGPDGILQTPFASPVPLADDRVSPVR